MKNRRPNYPDLLGQPSPALLRLNCSKSVDEVDGFIKGWKEQIEVLTKLERTPEQEKLMQRLETLMRMGKSRRRMLMQRNM